MQGAQVGALIFCGYGMIQFFLSAWRAGLRGRAVQTILFVGVLLVGVAYLAASFSPRQPRAVALDVGLSGVRISLVLLAVFWIQEFVAKEIERKTILMSIAFPVSRTGYLLGRYFGAVGLLGLAATLLGLLLWLAVLLAGGDQEYSVRLGMPYWFTVVGLWVDALVVAALTLAVAALSTTPMLAPVIGLMFAVAGKSLGAVADYLARGADGNVELVAAYQPVIELLRWFVPDLSRLDWRVWPMYGEVVGWPAVGWSLVMAGAYCAVMLALAVWSFERREFV